MGKWYFAKLFFLITATVFLSWYAHGGHSNLFRNTFHVLIRNKEVYIKYQKSDINQKKIILCAPDFSVSTDLFDEIPKSWDLLAGNLCLDPKTLPAPRSWSYTRACSSFVKPPQWPEPFVAPQAHVDNNTLKAISPFNDNRSGVEIILQKIPCLIITDTAFSCSAHETTLYKEQFECIILPGTNPALVDSIRSVFRPRYLIVIAPPKKAPRYSNVIYLDTFHSDTVFSITSSNTLKLKP